MDSGREQNYWPGFVDALSNVVLTLVFVIVIFVFALVMASNKVEQKIQQITESTTAKAGDAETQSLRQQVATLQSQLAKMQDQATASDQLKTGASTVQAAATANPDRQIAVTASDPSKNNSGPVEIAHVKDSVVLSYPLTVVTLDKKSEDQLGHVLEAIQQTVGTHKVFVKSFVGRETYSVARRTAYYRAVGARNYLITKMNEAPENISISIVVPTQPEDGHVEIQLENK